MSVDYGTVRTGSMWIGTDRPCSRSIVERMKPILELIQPGIRTGLRNNLQLPCRLKEQDRCRKERWIAVSWVLIIGDYDADHTEYQLSNPFVYLPVLSAIGTPDVYK